MADRTSSRHTASSLSRTRSAASNVRRNLFQSQLTRRPTAGSLASSSSNSAETIRLDAPDLLNESSADLVIRDKDGEVELGDPPTPPVDDADEVALDDRQENERERQRLADAVKHHQINQHAMPTQPEELLEAVRASLRAKVAALSEDDWMFEAEPESRHL